MKRRLAAALIGSLLALTPAAQSGAIVLPSGWRLTPAEGGVITVGTMPQGIALSPDGGRLALVESGVNPPALRVIDAPSLQTLALVQLPGAFGTPVWQDSSHVLVAGANADAVLRIDVKTRSVTAVQQRAKDSWPAAVAVSPSGSIATANDGDGTVTLDAASVRVGDHPAAVTFSKHGSTLFATVRQTNSVVGIDARTHEIVHRIAVGRHPGALALSADGNTLYVAESDDDSIGVIDTRTFGRTGGIDVGLHDGPLHGPGASPNALAVVNGRIYVSLGAENALAVVQNGRVIERIPAGWYPTGIAVGSDGTLYECNGYGERAPANPQFNWHDESSPGYVARLTTGSVRAIAASVAQNAAAQTQAVMDDARAQWRAPQRTIVRSGGPIKHIIYVIKENRTYDQVLGDLPRANGDAQLAAFGARVTPNQHAIAQRFGIFDNAYTDAQVSAPGHNWTDAAFSNDFVERRWPLDYGGRLKTYDFQSGTAPDAPHNGYLWDAAKRLGLSYRDYGEDIEFTRGSPIGVNTFAGLTGHFDPTYVGWDLHTSDLTRVAQWQREFDRFVRNRDLPQLEIVYLPNDHTAGTSPGMPTPDAYAAINDQAVGRLVDRVSHSPYWRSTAIFILEDDAQNGPDHVSDQRSTFYIASAYARGGVQHAHYSTTSFVRTIELLLGMPPLSIYDATARPLYDAFALAPINAQPYAAIPPQIDTAAVNKKTAYGAARSAALDFSKPDAADEAVLNDVLDHVR